jgi:hypothetical protein
MATTTNFGWETPDDTDLVKDGALAMRTLGNAIDTSLVDLKGGTTGQVLSKTSNTDMDFTWVTSDDANAIQNAIVDAKGDLITATAADTPARLAVGTNGHVLTADSTTATGLKWAAASGGLPNGVAYTPTLTNVTLGNGTLTAYYVDSGDSVFYYGMLRFGSTSSVTGNVQIDLPFNTSTAIGVGAFYGIGTAFFYDASTGTSYSANPAINNVDSVRFFLVTTNSTYGTLSSQIDSATPVSIASSDEINWWMWYRKA